MDPSRNSHRAPGLEPSERPLEISTSRTGSQLVVGLAGELDLSGVDEFARTVGRALSGEPPEVVCVEVTELSFIDSAGLQALLLARQASVAAGVGFRVVGVQPAVDRVVKLAGVETLLQDTGETRPRSA